MDSTGRGAPHSTGEDRPPKTRVPANAQHRQGLTPRPRMPPWTTRAPTPRPKPPPWAAQAEADPRPQNACVDSTAGADPEAPGPGADSTAASAPPGSTRTVAADPAGPAALTEQQQLELAPGVALIPPQLLLDLGVDPLGLLHLIAEATRHHGLQSHRPGPGRPPATPAAAPRPGPRLEPPRPRPPGPRRRPPGRPVCSAACERRSRSATHSSPAALPP